MGRDQVPEARGREEGPGGCRAQGSGPHLLAPGGQVRPLSLGCPAAGLPQARADPDPQPWPGAGSNQESAMGLLWWPEGGHHRALAPGSPEEVGWQRSPCPSWRVLPEGGRGGLGSRPSGWGTEGLCPQAASCWPRGRCGRGGQPSRLGPAHPLLWPRKGSSAVSEHLGGGLS